MAMKEDLYFKVNPEIKDILGRGLIYDDNIAIIELVKNSKDADSNTVSIKFHKENNGGKDSYIIISDYGTGMTYSDIKYKWLNMAYSEKKNATKGESFFAGNKGVGRFSCDRLGKVLQLYTKSEKGEYIKLYINWEDFEDKNVEDEIGDIKLHYEMLKKEDFLTEINDSSFKTGTILKIMNLRNIWDEDSLGRLISELSRFSPSLVDNEFEIYVYSDTPYDGKIKKDINKKVNNNLLDKIAFKTTYIQSCISADGKHINTKLFFQGEQLYEYKAKNPYKRLKDIKIEIHYLDTLSKTYFTKTFRGSANDYGSIFLYYNNFRISSYGNPKNDWLGIDQRQSQGNRRYVGTRDLVGKITITDYDNTFSVMTSREGLVKSRSLQELISIDKDILTFDDKSKREKKTYGFVGNIIRQLENFVVDGLSWNRLVDKFADESVNSSPVRDIDVIKDPNRYKFIEVSARNIQEACDKILKSDFEIIDFNVNQKAIANSAHIINDKYNRYVEDFCAVSGNKSIADLSSHDKGVISKIIRVEQNKTKIAEENATYAEEKRRVAEKEVEKKEEVIKQQEMTIEQVTSENFFLNTISNQDIDTLILNMHSVVTATEIINNKIFKILNNFELDAKLRVILGEIEEENHKIYNISKFATLKNFNNKTQSIYGELIIFIKEYLKELSTKFRSYSSIKIIDSLDAKLILNLNFVPLEIMMLIDNLINNSIKADAEVIKFESIVSKGKSTLLITDNGNGISKDITDVKKLLNKGVTTTNGSGLGLYHVNKIVNSLGGEVIINKLDDGFQLGVVFNEA